MRNLKNNLLSLTLLIFFISKVISSPVVIEQQCIDVNNIRTYFYNTGIFNVNLHYSNTPGFEWPKNSNKYAIFTSGITIAAKVFGALRMASASYKGEYAPGYVNNSSGVPVTITNSQFHIYNVRKTDPPDSTDRKYWGNMIPFGAPYVDVNNNGAYEYFIDIPGVKDADQTLFICITDGFPDEHKLGEGFGGGTAPLYAEVHFLVWSYNKPGLEDVIFVKQQIINKNVTAWNDCCISLLSDPDIGDKEDDYTGCDTIRKMSYCYNLDNYDSIYGANPPAVGYKWLECQSNNNNWQRSYVYIHYSSPPTCEDPSESFGAYNMMHGIKADLTPWVIPPGGSSNLITKNCYSGDPETGSGWNEGIPGSPTGSVANCGGSLIGNITVVNPPYDRFILMNKGGNGYTVNSNDTVTIMFAELIARGNSNLNSVTKLKVLADNVQQFCNNGFIIGINQTSNEIPLNYNLYQNYPNPFNPATKIKFSIPQTPLNPPFNKGGTERSEGGFVKLAIYDILGQEVASLIPPLWGGQEGLYPGTYEIDWNASDYPSGVYFYKLEAGKYSQTKKMVLIK
jgi:hypothetical protein